MTRSVPRQADERRTAAEKGIVVAAPSGRDAGTVPAVTRGATLPVPYASIPTGPGYQTGFSAAIRTQAGILTGAVGFITEPVQAEHILRTGQADAVFLARAMLRDPYWPLRAARLLGAELDWPVQYRRAKV